MVTGNSSDKLLAAKKICQTVQSTDRKLRKQCYLELEKLLADESFTESDLRQVFAETQVYFLNGLRDKSEIVREQAIKFVTFLLTERLPLNDFYLTYVFPVIVERIGTVELVEDSEEVRLQMVQMLNAIIKKYSNSKQLKPFLNDSVTILGETVKDKHPSVKELCCQTIVLLAQALPSDFHMRAEYLIKPVLTCFSHQRYKVRVEAIRAIGEIIMHSSYKGVDEVVVPMAEKLFDQIPAVRQAVAQEASRWLLKHRDRYSYFHKMLPLLLTGLNDEVDATRTEAEVLWQAVGLQYQKENEKDLKDKLDYLLEPPKHYPSHLRRPNLGCRVLVQRNISKLAGAISNELTNWQEDVRVRCSQLLCSLALHAEEDLTFNLQSLLPAMYSAARDDDQRVVSNIRRASEIIGVFVSFETWSKLVLPVIEDGPHYGHLAVLSSLIAGAPKEIISDSIESVAKLLAEDYICNSRKKMYQLELLRCVHIMMDKLEPSCGLSSGYFLFKMITSLVALKDPENAPILTADLYNKLATTLGLQSKQNVFVQFSNQLFNHVNDTPKLWTVVNENACVFLTLLELSEEAFGLNLDVIVSVLIEVLDGESDAEMRLKTFYTLATVFEEKTVIFKLAGESLAPFLDKLVSEVFVPSLVWRAGATAEAVRTMAATCLKFALMPTEGVDLFSKLDVWRATLPLLLSLVEDASARSRQVAIECLTLLKGHFVEKGVWQEDDLIKIYPEVLKRLDDPTEAVRLCALDSLPKFFGNIPEEFLRVNYKAHRELIIDTLMTHLDDDEEVVQNLALEALKVMAKMNGAEMLKKLEVHRPLLRNQKGCSDIVDFLNSLPC